MEADPFWKAFLKTKIASVEQIQRICDAPMKEVPWRMLLPKIIPVTCCCHLQSDRIQTSKVTSVLSDSLFRLTNAHQMNQNYCVALIHEFIIHLSNHFPCVSSITLLLSLVRKCPNLFEHLTPQEIYKIQKNILLHHTEKKKIQFLEWLKPQKFQIRKKSQTNEKYLNIEKDINKARQNMNKMSKWNEITQKKKEKEEESDNSQRKIPPLILPSAKSVPSSRFSASGLSKRKGIDQMRILGAALGESFIAIQLGSLLSFKRTKQAQDFIQNSQFRSQCFEKAKLKIKQSETQSNKFINNLKNQEKFILIWVNILFEKSIIQQNNKTNISNKKTICSEKKQNFRNILKTITKFIVGKICIIKSEFGLQNIVVAEQLNIRSFQQILQSLLIKLSFQTEKTHLWLLRQRDEQTFSTIYKQNCLKENEKQKTKNNYIERSKHTVRFGGITIQQFTSFCQDQHCKAHLFASKIQTDQVLFDVSGTLRNLLIKCNSQHSMFFQILNNLLNFIGFYVNQTYNGTICCLILQFIFPYLIIGKKVILQLFLINLQTDYLSSQFKSSSKKSAKKIINSNVQQQLKRQLLSNLMYVFGGLIGTSRQSQKLIINLTLKNKMFMSVIQKHIGNLLINKQDENLRKMFNFYGKCLDAYQQRKQKNHETKSFKALFAHLSLLLEVKEDSEQISNWLQKHSWLVSPPICFQPQREHQVLNSVLQFILRIYSQELQSGCEVLEEQTAAFYLKFCINNFIKLYSFTAVNELLSLDSLCRQDQLTTKQSPHSIQNQTNVQYMLAFLRILKEICCNKTPEIRKKIKQFRILQFFVRQFQLQFSISENLDKYNKITKKPALFSKSLISPKVISSPSKVVKSGKNNHQKKEQRKSVESQKNKQVNKVPFLKLPIKGGFKEEEKPGQLDGLIEKIKKKSQFSLQLGRLNADNRGGRSTEDRDVVYKTERKIRKLYSDERLHAQSIGLVLSLVLHKGLLDEDYCDQFPITHGKTNVLHILHFHLNHPQNRSVVDRIAQIVPRLRPALSGQRLLKLLSSQFLDLSAYHNYSKITAGAYGVIYSCDTNLEEPKQVVVKQMSFPKNIYQRCVLHDIFTEITCLQNFRLDGRITTLYDYGVSQRTYVIIMKKYDCSLKDYVLEKINQNKECKHNKEWKAEHEKQMLVIFRDILQVVAMLHTNNVTHYDIKADNVLLQKRNGRPKVVLADFGESRMFDGESEEADLRSRGTQCIKSPQMLTLALHCKKQADHYDRRKRVGTTRASDLWSLGCLLYEIVTGEFLFHNPQWANFYFRVTFPTENLLPEEATKKIVNLYVVDFLKFLLIRDPHHRPSVRTALDKINALIELVSAEPEVCSITFPYSKAQKQIKNYIQNMHAQLNHHIQKQYVPSLKKTNQKYQHSKLLKIMDDIYFQEKTDRSEQKMLLTYRQLKISHIVTTLQVNESMKNFSILQINVNKEVDGGALACKIIPQVSDFLKQVLLIKGKLLFINDQKNYASNILVYLLSFWFKCSVYQCEGLINSQVLRLKTQKQSKNFMSFALFQLQNIQKSLESKPKLQCICGRVTIIFHTLSGIERRRECCCKQKKEGSFSDCPSSSCSMYLQFLKNRYSINWNSVKWNQIKENSLITNVVQKQNETTGVMLTSKGPFYNIKQMPSCRKGWKMYVCHVCLMVIAAVNDQKKQTQFVMNNLLKKHRQGIMVPNAQQNFKLKTPILQHYSLGKLHQTQPNQ